MSIFTDILSGGLKGVGDSIKSVINAVKADPTKVVELEEKERELDEKLEELKLTLDSQLQEAYLKDSQDARNREIQIATSDKAPLLNKIITPVLALIVVIGGGYMSYTAKTPDERTAYIGIIMLCLGYYFGSSIGSKVSGDAIRKLASGK